MNLENYNKSFDEITEFYDEQADTSLRDIRQQCVRDFINKLNRRRADWDETFRILLAKSREDDIVKSNIPPQQPIQQVQINSNLTNSVTAGESSFLANLSTAGDLAKENEEPKTQESKDTTTTVSTTTNPDVVEPEVVVDIVESEKVVSNNKTNEFVDEHFSNSIAIKNFIKLQEMLQNARQTIEDINSNVSLKPFKNQLSLYIKTQINSISNSETSHLETKAKNLANLFLGRRVEFQDRVVDATQHPSGQMFAMDFAAVTFVTVGTRLVNSVPAIAKSMAFVINRIADNNLSGFKDLVFGHLQERCPYLIPMHPSREDYKDIEANFKIACGYSYDTKSQILESEEKYLSRMRSMVLIYSCLLMESNIGLAWTWLASYLTLIPQPVMSATVLQAFLQESSKKLSSTYGRQYKKLIAFVKDHYLAMIEQVTTKDKQSFIKLKNLLSDDTSLFEAPKISSIFGSIRY